MSDAELSAVESRLGYARGQCHSHEAREELLKRMDECRAEVHRRMAAKPDPSRYL